MRFEVHWELNALNRVTFGSGDGFFVVKVLLTWKYATASGIL